MPPKITFIGAGSLGFTRRLMQDIVTVPELSDAQLAFTDIDKTNLERIANLAKRDLKHNKKGAVVTATTDRKKALEGADYIISCVRVGGIEGFRGDIEIPLKYGIDQCVGDTLCIGGIMYGQRNIPVTLDFCRDIREVAKPDALYLNYANPNAMNTWAANNYGDVPCVGLCHGVQGGHWAIANVIQHLINKGKKEGDKGFRSVSVDEVDIICAGLNHQTWYIQVLFDGQDWCDRLLEGFESHPWFSKAEKVRIDMLRRFGYFSTESNGHLSEYVSWYRKRPSETMKWVDLSSWINGETGGYLRVITENRHEFDKMYPKWIKDAPPDYSAANRSHEHGSRIIESLETGRVYRGHFNVVNGHTITNLPEDIVVEVPGYVDRNGISIPVVGDLPTACAAICSQSAFVQRLSVEAAVEGDIEKLKQAALLDPLTGAVCTTEEISQMVDEMVVAQAKWLPQYRHDVAAAKKRLASCKRLGTNKWKGAALLPPKKAK